MKRSVNLVGALALAGLLSSLEASALTLGRLKVLSALGQPLVAEIEVPEISAEEANSLRVGVANPEAFKSAGLDYNAIVNSLSIAGKRRPDGRALLELRSSQPVTEPFLDLVLEISWANGRMVRDYTLLLDPQTGSTAAAPLPTPTLPIQSAPAASAAPQIAPANALSAASAPAVEPRGAISNQFSIKTGQASVTSKSAAPVGNGQRFSVSTQPRNKTTKSTRLAKADKANAAKQVVQRGDTAAAIAAANKPEGVSLDQMLVAMLRANPDAFVDGNINRLKTGALLDIPSQEDAASVGKAAAKNNIQVQARDFNDYRRKLAGIVTSSPGADSARQTSGRVTAKVDDKKPSAQAQDKLTLTKPNSAGTPIDTAAEDKIAKQRSAADAAVRTSELQKNITDLDKIAQAPVGSAPPATSPPPPPTAPTASTSEPAALPAPPAAPVAVTSEATSEQPKKQGFLQQMTSHPWALPAGGGLLGLLGLGALWSMRQRRKAKESDSMNPQNSLNFPATRSATDTVFGAMGANQVNTQETSSGNSTMVYPPSQLSSASGDVDPIAEADVYLAYNRDVQAEEILKEAKRATPNRADIQVKLMEIYTKRRDTEAFDAAAQELHLLTDGGGQHWAKARELAKEVGSAHSLFNVGASAFAVSESAHSQSAYNNNSLLFAPSPSVAQYQNLAPQSTPQPTQPSQGGLIDFDLSALTLDLPQSIPTQSMSQAATTSAVEDPKLALAEEYLSIGDKAGARALIQDVITHGSPNSLAAAQQLLTRIG